MKIKKIYIERDLISGYESFTYNSDEIIDTPFIAGKLKSLIPESIKFNQKEKVRTESSTPLFNDINWTKRIVSTGANGVYYLILRPGYWLSELLCEPEELIIDLYIGAEDNLIYSFLNTTDEKTIVIMGKLLKDTENIYSKISNYRDDIIFRQYYIKRAIRKIGSSDPPPAKTFPEIMNANEAADYLSIEVKTLRNWTSDKKIPHTKIGGTVRYRKSDIDRFLETNSVIPKDRIKRKK